MPSCINSIKVHLWLLFLLLFYLLPLLLQLHFPHLAWLLQPLLLIFPPRILCFLPPCLPPKITNEKENLFFPITEQFSVHLETIRHKCNQNKSLR